MILTRRYDQLELAAVFVAGLVFGLWLSWFFYPEPAEAGGPTAITWSQPTDCDVVTGWELLSAPITTANPNPNPTAATIQSIAAPPCGTSLTKTITVAGVGSTRFWIRALAGTIRSGESNHIDANLTLGKPGLISVAP